MRIIWQTVRRITNEILGVKGLRVTSISFLPAVSLLNHSLRENKENKGNNFQA